MRLTLGEIARVLDCRSVPGLSGETAALRPGGASVDSRRTRPGHLFFCLPGERVDGHDFAPVAVRAGAVAVIGTRDPFAGASPVPVFVVPDSVRALGMLARAHRDGMRGKVIGITGSAGKTSLKEALATVLARAGETEKNPLNLNNQIGLPLSMLNSSETAAFWVMEAGISKPHDMDELGGILHPDVAVVLNVCDVHAEFLGDRGVAHYKAKLLDYLAPGGTAVVSADYPDLLAEASARPGKTVTFSGHAGGAPFSAEAVAPITTDAGGDEGGGATNPAGEGRGCFRVVTPGGTFTVTAPFQGAIGAENTAAVTAAASSLGLDAALIPSLVADGLGRMALPAQRGGVEKYGVHAIVDGSYNANPLAMARTLDNAAELAKARNLSLVLALGEMGELGEEAERRHEELGKHAAALDPALIFWKGDRAGAVRKGLLAGGYAGTLIRADGADEFMEGFRQARLPGALVMFKASRSKRMDLWADAFRAAYGPRASQSAQSGQSAQSAQFGQPAQSGQEKGEH